MAAPTATTRQTPVGLPLEDGFSTLITFAADPDVSIWEKIVTPFGIDGGPPIDQTSMHNTAWTTQRLQHLKSVTGGQFECSFSSAALDQIMALINVETIITYRLPNGAKWCKHGGLTSFKPNRFAKGTQPTAMATIEATNLDSSGAEYGPNVITAAGTD